MFLYLTRFVFFPSPASSGRKIKTDKDIDPVCLDLICRENVSALVGMCRTPHSALHALSIKGRGTFLVFAAISVSNQLFL